MENKRLLSAPCDLKAHIHAPGSAINGLVPVRSGPRIVHSPHRSSSTVDNISLGEKSTIDSKKNISRLTIRAPSLRSPTHPPTYSHTAVNMPSLRALIKPSPLPISTSTATNTHQPLPTPVTTVLLSAWDTQNFGHSADALADWINLRWRKSGYEVSRETVCFTLRLHGRDARMGVRDPLEGAFHRVGL